MAMEASSETQKKSNTIWLEIWDFVKTVIIFAIIYVVIRTYVAQPFLVRGRSMEQTFSDGDYLVVDELSYRFREPKRFEVIVFKTDFLTENAPQEYYIKRIIGLPGDRVVIKDGKVLVYENNSIIPTELSEAYIADGIQTLAPELVDITLGENKYFVLGDNRGNSSDSRYWGELDKSYIVGKPMVRLLPLNNLTFFSQEEFEGN